MVILKYDLPCHIVSELCFTVYLFIGSLYIVYVHYTLYRFTIHGICSRYIVYVHYIWYMLRYMVYDDHSIASQRRECSYDTRGHLLSVTRSTDRHNICLSCLNPACLGRYVYKHRVSRHRYYAILLLNRYSIPDRRCVIDLLLAVRLPPVDMQPIYNVYICAGIILEEGITWVHYI